MMPKRGSMKYKVHNLLRRAEVSLATSMNPLTKLILDQFYYAPDHDMIIDSAETILGMPSPNHPRPRYSYPISATEWTEYTSPLSKPRANFYIDSTGDRLQPTGTFRHGLIICRN